MDPLGERLTATSPAFPRERLQAIVREAKPFHVDGHYLYPADDRGNHLQGFFLLEPVAAHPEFVRWIAEDCVAWAEREEIEFDLFFAPARPAVKTLVEAGALRAGRPSAYRECLPSGRFGERLVEGRVARGARALIFNGVTHTGRCFGQRLPAFVGMLGGTAVAAAVFTKGSAPKVAETEGRLGERLHSAIRAEIPIFAPPACPLCARGRTCVPWTDLLRRGAS